ncbi:hypothetical protein EVAR_69183_1 [Eumeta japonica]|uniref:Uncharacterized protein n=1 Tax=Eumeta variegata TaxID=151549 RepID=A0A4C1ZHC8_EUMVA|nr:hypothetical protein EVAR_69183_1 [Eumeta japonica]
MSKKRVLLPFKDLKEWWSGVVRIRLDLYFQRNEALSKQWISLQLSLRSIFRLAKFRKTGICPLSRNIFNDIDFAPSYVTDRPNPNETNLINDTNTAAVIVNPMPEDDNSTRTISPSILHDELTGGSSIKSYNIWK